MLSTWTAVIWLASLLASLMFLKRWLNAHLQGLGLLLSGDREVAVLFNFLVLLPGVVLHEVSHWAVARLLGVRTGRLSIVPKRKSQGRISFGSVRVAAVDPVRESIIGLAPLIVGCTLILGLGHWRFATRMITPLTLEAVLSLLRNLILAPDAWVWLYLIFAISNAMLPSDSDLRPWRTLLIFLIAAVAILYFAGGGLKIPTVWREMVQTAVNYLNYALVLTATVDVIFLALILLVEKIGEIILHRKVEY